MNKMKLAIVCALLLFWQVYVHAQSESNIFGRVVDEETNEGVPGVHAYLSNIDVIGQDEVIVKNPYSSISDENGNFKISNVLVDNTPFEYELIIHYENIPGDLSSKYYDQGYTIKRYMLIGKNLFLKPIKLKRGKSVHGSLKLWDGTLLKDAKIKFTLVNPDDPDYFAAWWVYWNADLSFDSAPIPYERDLKMEVEYIKNPSKNVSYGCVSKVIRVPRTGGSNLEVTVPFRNTSITGRVMAQDGTPISGQDVKIFKRGCDSEVTSDQNGNFIFRSLETDTIDMMISYKNIGILKNYFIKQIVIDNDETIKIEIVMSSDYFDYKLVREKIESNF